MASGRQGAGVTRMVQQLNQADRLTLLMYYVDRLTTNEIATVLDTPVEKVESRLRRVRTSTRAIVGRPAARQPDQLQH